MEEAPLPANSVLIALRSNEKRLHLEFQLKFRFSNDLGGVWMIGGNRNEEWEWGMGMEGMGNGNPRSVEVLIYPPRGNEIPVNRAH